MALAEIVTPTGVAQNVFEMSRGNIGTLTDIQEINGQPMIQNVSEIPATPARIFVTVD